MKITKSRLLQIIREEVELHEKNTFELDEELIDTSADKDGDNKLSKSEKSDALRVAINQDKMKNPENVEECGMEQEDRIFGPKDKEGSRPIVQPEKNGGKLEIKIKR